MIKNIFYCKINLYQLTVDFCTSDKGTTPPQIKFKRTQKFEPKILVWIAVSESGILKPFFSKQKQSVNQTTDLDKCIIARLMQFIQSYHIKEKVLLWSDLASSHYMVTKSCSIWMQMVCNSYIKN